MHSLYVPATYAKHSHAYLKALTSHIVELFVRRALRYVREPRGDLYLIVLVRSCDLEKMCRVLCYWQWIRDCPKYLTMEEDIDNPDV